MKKRLIGLGITALVVGGVGSASAGLLTIGTATYGGSDYNLIWDDDNNGKSVVWLDYTNNSANLATQKAWAAGLDDSITYHYNSTYSINWDDADWRLPDVEIFPVYEWDTEAELGHLYYTEFSLELRSPSNAYTTAELNAVSDFDHLIGGNYWSVPGDPFSNDAFTFSLATGHHYPVTTGADLYGLALRTGEVVSTPTPEPATMILFGTGLAGLAGLRIRRKKK